jgi:hypothetical protein
VVLEDVIREAGADADAADAARGLREVGVAVTRNSAAEWIADPADPRVLAWKRRLAETAVARSPLRLHAQVPLCDVQRLRARSHLRISGDNQQKRAAF